MKLLEGSVWRPSAPRRQIGVPPKGHHDPPTDARRGRGPAYLPGRRLQHDYPRLRLRQQRAGRGRGRAPDPRYAEDHDRGQRLHRARRLDRLGARARHDPRAARGRLAHRAGRRPRRRARTRRVAAAWAAYKPDAAWPLKVANQTPDKDGWTEAARLRLPDVAQREARRRRGRPARRRHRGRSSSTTWRRPSARSAARRSALIFGELLPKGYARESFAGKKAHTARRGADRGARRSSSRRRMQGTGVPGVARRPRAGRQGRVRRRLRRARARQAREGRRATRCS